jgi:hypothetical protein
MTATGGIFAHRARNQGRNFAIYKVKKGRETLDRFADALAEHGDVSRAAAQAGKSAIYGRILLQKLRKRLGWQAR